MIIWYDLGLFQGSFARWLEASTCTLDKLVHKLELRMYFFSLFWSLVSLWLGMASLQIPSSNRLTAPMPTDSLYYRHMWKLVDSLLEEGLEKQALAKVKEIYHHAVAQKNYPQQVKAFMQEIYLRADVEEDEQKLFKAIYQEAQQQPTPVKQLLYYFLAENYIHYSRQISDDYFLVEEDTSSNPLKWSAKKLKAEIHRLYLASLEDADSLQKIPIQQWRELFSTEVNPSESDLKISPTHRYRPTLYDFLAHAAIDYLIQPEANYEKTAHNFEINAVELFAPLSQFEKLTFDTKDTANTQLSAIIILQQLATFHRRSNHWEALADLDLKRLELMYKYATLPDKDEAYEQALIQAQKTYANTPLVADFAYEQAALYLERGQKFNRLIPGDPHRFMLKTALEIAESTVKKYPNTQGANNCQRLIRQLKEDSFSVEVEAVNAANQPFRFLLTYRNLSKLWCKAISLTDQDWQKIEEEGSRKDIQNLIAQDGITWRVTLPPDEGDMQKHAVEIAAPALSWGKYLLVLANNPTFESNNEGKKVAYAVITISDMAFVERTRNNFLEYLLVDRTTGAPIAGAKVEVILQQYNYRRSRYKSLLYQTLTTDAEGMVRVERYIETKPIDFETSSYGYVLINFIHPNGKDRLDNASQNNVIFASNADYYSTAKEDTTTSVHFFTDRSIYRPGQTIYYKILLTKQFNGQRRPVKNAGKVIVSLKNYSQDSLASQEVTINEFGSGSGSFLIPTNIPLGKIYLTALQTAQRLRVEEYKRPNFEVNINSLAQAVKLGQQVEVTGIAQAYSGAALDNATVKYRVVRKPYYVSAWWWERYVQETPTEIASGTLKTSQQGKFSIRFSALPDKTIASSLQPVFNFEITVEVTDINGETQSATKNIFIGHQAIRLNAEIPEKVALEKGSQQVKIMALNAEQQNIAIQGTAKLIKLKSPDRIFRQRLWEPPDLFAMSKEEFYKLFPNDPYASEDIMPNWEVEKTVISYNFDTQKQPEITLPLQEVGGYLLEISAKDPFGSDVISRSYFTVYSQKSGPPPYPIALWTANLPSVNGSDEVVEPSDVARWQIGSSFTDAYIRYETEVAEQVASSHWLKINNQVQIQTFAIEQRHTGNVAMRVTMIRNGRFYQFNRLIQVPHTDKQLNITFETFRNKLNPGQKEEWRLKISNRDGTADRATAEMVATLYDASLDAFEKHNFYFPEPPLFGIAHSWYEKKFGKQLFSLMGNNPDVGSLQVRYYDQLRWLDEKIVDNYLRRFLYDESDGEFYDYDPDLYDSRVMRSLRNGTERAESIEANGSGVAESTRLEEGEKSTQVLPMEAKEPTQVSIRRDFRETAFFYPHLQTDEEGNLIIQFTVPESLTRWKLLGFAHKKDMRYGFVQKEVVTQKELMIAPNPPRFFRQGDQMTFTAKIINLSDHALSGEAQIQFFDAITMQPIDVQMYPRMVEAMSAEAIAQMRSKKTFVVAQGQSIPLKWEIQIPNETVQAITYRIVARAGSFSDGEERTLPVLTDRILLTETLPLSVRDGQTKTFELKNLTHLTSQSLQHHSLTFEFTNNPTWYALQALPYLMEYPHECAEQTFSRFYANSIAAHIVNSHPKIKEVFDAWQKQEGGSALASNLQKNEWLKYLLLQETPWVRQAFNEADRKRTIAVLFDLVRMSQELENALAKLERIQYSDGSFPWFEGMPASRWVTQHILAGLGHLKHLGVINLSPDALANVQPHSLLTKPNTAYEIALRALKFLDRQIFEDYQRLQKMEKEGKIKLADLNISYEAYHYLYARSFFLDIKPSKPEYKTAINYFLNQAEKHWNKAGLYVQGMAALTLHRNGRKAIAQTIAQSLKERAIINQEKGMYWKANYGYWWYELPIETQSLMIEVFSEVASDDRAVNDLKIWLLKQKQTQDWSTTKATAEAIYALLLQGDNWLTEPATANIYVGSQEINPAKMEQIKVEAGTGYFQVKWTGKEINPEMGKVTITKFGKGIAWGSLYWQYFESLDKVTPAETPLKLSKQLYIERVTEKGIVLQPLTEQTLVKIGDKIRVRIELQADRPMEYVHLKDMRAAAFEPLDTQSGYDDYTECYRNIRDSAIDFFFSWLPKGTSVIEYSLRASQVGDFSNGVATAQCMYAPEFTSHSKGIRVKIVE